MGPRDHLARIVEQVDERLAVRRMFAVAMQPCLALGHVHRVLVHQKRERLVVTRRRRHLTLLADVTPAAAAGARGRTAQTHVALDEALHVELEQQRRVLVLAFFVLVGQALRATSLDGVHVLHVVVVDARHVHERLDELGTQRIRLAT